jgi:hypothetical protein
VSLQELQGLSSGSLILFGLNFGDNGELTRPPQKFFGTNYGLTSKIPKSSFKITQGQTKVHEADNGSGTLLHREFCSNCGSGILEYGANAGDFVYIMYGTLDKPMELPPKGEFFCKYRDGWMPEVPGMC